MPTGHYLDDEAKQDIILQGTKGATSEELAKKYKVIPGTITRILRLNHAVPVKKAVRQATQEGNAFEAEVRRLRATGMTITAIAKKLDVNKSRVSYHLYMKASRTKKMAALSPAVSAMSGRAVKADVMNQKVQALRKEGLGAKAIADRLNVPLGKVRYYFYSYERNHSKSSSEGAETNGHDPLNKYVKYGIAYAETERFLSALSERLDVDAKVLRLTISGLLGRETLR